MFGTCTTGGWIPNFILQQTTSPQISSRQINGLDVMSGDVTSRAINLWTLLFYPTPPVSTLWLIISTTNAARTELCLFFPTHFSFLSHSAEVFANFWIPILSLFQQYRHKDIPLSRFLFTMYSNIYVLFSPRGASRRIAMSTSSCTVKAPKTPSGLFWWQALR